MERRNYLFKTPLSLNKFFLILKNVFILFRFFVYIFLAAIVVLGGFGVYHFLSTLGKV